MTILGLAETVATPDSDAMVIDQGNAKAGWLPIPEAVAREVAFAVKVGPGILAIDADSPQQTALLFELRSGLVERSIRCVVVASGQPGHHHLFARIRDQDLMTWAEGWCRFVRLDVRSNGQRIRPPLSPHRRGFPVRLLEPETAADALEILGGIENAVESGGRGIPGRFHRMLGEAVPRGHRSEALWAAYHEAIKLGISDERIIEAILAAPLGEKAREKPNPIQWLTAELRRARSKSHQSSRNGHSRVEGVHEAVRTTDWPGMAGVTDRAVLLAHLQVAQRIGRLHFDLSVRSAAALAGVSVPTIIRSRRRLSDSGWLRCTRPGAGRDAGSWEIMIPSAVRDRYHIGTPPHSEDVLTTATPPVGHDAFRWVAGLGKTAPKVLAVLDLNEPHSAAELARRAAVGRSTLSGRRSLLRRLEDVGLACETAEGWLRVDRDWDQVAADLGSLGTLARQQDLHRQQRASYYAHLDSHNANAPKPTPGLRSPRGRPLIGTEEEVRTLAS